jgi:hypothetical protein
MPRSTASRRTVGLLALAPSGKILYRNAEAHRFCVQLAMAEGRTPRRLPQAIESAVAGLPDKSARSGEAVRVPVGSYNGALVLRPFLIASTVNTVIGQRLVRRVADDRDAYQTAELETRSVQETVGTILPKTKQDVAKVSEDLGYKDLPLANQNAYTLVKGKDTPKTPGGFKGRVGLYEVMDVTDEIQALIVKRSTSAEIQKMAIAQGMVSMRQDGYLKSLQGLTTLDEVNRVAANMA